jgi:hypothetical protein
MRLIQIFVPLAADRRRSHVGAQRLGSLFSPAGRRWPEGSDEGASEIVVPPHRLALLGTSPRGEKREQAAPPISLIERF